MLDVARPSASGRTTLAWPGRRVSSVLRMSGPATAPFQPGSDGTLSLAYVTNPSFFTSRTTAMPSARASLPRNAIRADQKSASSRTLICASLAVTSRYAIDDASESIFSSSTYPDVETIRSRG